MKITEIKMVTLELPEGGGPGRMPQLVQVPNLRRIQYHAGRNPERTPIETPPAKPRASFLEVRTDEGITGRVPDEEVQKPFSMDQGLRAGVLRGLVYASG